MADSFVFGPGWTPLLAQAGGGAGGGDLFGSTMFPIMIVATALMFYFILMRPEQKKRKVMEQTLANLKKNDHVVTIGGIYGTVVATHDPKMVIIRVDDTTGTKLRVLRSAISHVGPPDEAEPDGKPAA